MHLEPFHYITSMINVVLYNRIKNRKFNAVKKKDIQYYTERLS